MKKCLLACLLCLLTLPFGLQASSLAISEFMANNSRVLLDENGSAEDWIEIRNVASTNVNVDGWYLTDNAGNLTKWRFPATNINVGSYLIVFASNKDRKTPGRPLHTNFKLSTTGGFLALVEPDGVTLATAFVPYPQQVPNVSFGFGIVSSNTTLIGPAAAVRALIPSTPNGGNTLADAWKGGAEPFNDAAWRNGVTGVGFSAATAPSLVATSALVVRLNFDAAPAGTVLPDTKPIGPAINGANNLAYWIDSSTDNSPNPVARAGVMQFISPTNSQVTLPGNAKFNSSRGTISFWMRTLGEFGPAHGPIMVMDRELITPNVPPNGNIQSGGFIQQNDDGRLSILAFTNGLPANTTVSSSAPSDDRWHHVAVVYDQTATGSVAIYLDGLLDSSSPNARAWAWAGTQIELGSSHEASFRKYNGFLDDFRLYNQPLTPAEISQVYNGDGGVAPSDIGLNLESDMLNVSSSAFLRLPFTVADTNAISQITLRIRHDDGFVAWINGRLVANVNAPDPLEWNSAATDTHSTSLADSITFGNPPGLLQNGVNILAIQGLNRSAADPTFLVLPQLIATSVPVETTNGVYFTQPTPGAPNTGGTTNTGPLITDVGHTPNVPADNDDLLVTARIAPTFNLVGGVTLRYRIMFANEVSVPMNDGGTNGDKTAGDGLWSAFIPASASTNGEMIRYLVAANDIRGNSSRWPLFYNPTNSEEYLGTVVSPDYVTSKIPIFHMFVNPPDQAAMDGDLNGARMGFFYDGEFYDHARIEFRGNSSASFRKKAHRLEFNHDHPFRHLPGFPRVSDTSLLGESADPAYLRQLFSLWMHDAMGTPSPFDYPVRVQLNTGFYQLAMHSDVLGPGQLQRLGYDPNGALYKAVGQVKPTYDSTGGFQKKTRLFEDRSDYLALANGIHELTNAATRAINVFDMMDVPNIINYLAVSRWTQEGDDVWANMSLYRDTEGDQLWRIIPFDLNVSWGQLYCGDNPGAYQFILSTNDNFKSHPLYGGSTVTGGNGSWNRVCDVIYQTPATREMLLRRMRTLLDTFVQPPETHPLAFLLDKKILAFTNAVYADAILDRLKWGWESTVVGQALGPYCFGANQWITNHTPRIVNEFIVPHRRHWYVTHSITNTARPTGVGPTDKAGIPLTQPDDATISITKVEFNPASGNQAEEFICLTNGNPYAVDISGWKLGGGVDFTFKGGTVMPSNQVLYVTPNTRAFRNRAVAPHGGSALFAVGPYKGQLSARGEPLTITDARGRLVYTNSYVGAPSLAQQFLRVTEIMYHPPALAGTTADPRLGEYIELKNISTTTPISLTGVRFVNGIAFDFTGSAVTTLAPGQRVLVVHDLAGFTARYGTGFNIAGAYVGALNSAGERLQLVDAVNEEIHDFGYNNSWYPITDGAGFSLVVVDENADTGLWDQKAGWRPSGVVNGAPGQADVPTPTFTRILINEVLTHAELPLVDTIELLNPSTNNVNLGGWFLSDDFNEPKKFRIPDGTILPAGGLITFDESQFNTPTNAPTSFALSSKGDVVWLFSGDAQTNLTGFLEGEDFGAAATGVSLGRYTNSIGRVHFVAQKTRTLGTPNSGPLVGPVVISEIHYHPPDFAGHADNAGDEFIELHNVASTNVPLYLPLAPTNTWQLHGTVDFELPGGLSLGANGYLLLVNFDPADSALAAAFRARFDVPANVPMYGPYRGKLDNSAGDVRLTRPDMPVGLVTPAIVADRVEYAQDTGWPTGADGTGASLQRRDPRQFGDDPINWFAAAPSAGRDSSDATPPTITRQPVGGNAVATLSTSLSITAAGTAPLGYQWYFDGIALPGANGASLNLDNLQTENAGTYFVAVYNGAGTAYSDPATLTVLLPAVINQQPASAALRPGTNVTFSVVAISSSTIHYQWRQNGVNIPGATGPTLTLTGIGIPQAGAYMVVLTDDVGTISSLPAVLTILIDPVITEQPLGAVVAPNSTVAFSVAVSNTATLPVGFRWRRNGVTVSSNSLNSFVSTYVGNAGPTGAFFTVVVANQSRPNGVLSSSALVSVITDTDGDGIPDAYETANGLNPNDATDAGVDSDGDSMTNLEEYLAGTNPRDASSYLKVERIAATGSAVLQFNAVSNHAYSIVYGDAVTNSAWTKLADVTARLTNRVETITDSSAISKRFYRLVTPPVP